MTVSKVQTEELKFVLVFKKYRHFYRKSVWRIFYGLFVRKSLQIIFKASRKLLDLSKNSKHVTLKKTYFALCFEAFKGYQRKLWLISYYSMHSIALKLKNLLLALQLQLRTRLKMQRLFSICMQSCLFGNRRKIFTTFKSQQKCLILQNCERSEQHLPLWFQSSVGLG